MNMFKRSSKLKENFGNHNDDSAAWKKKTFLGEISLQSHIGTIFNRMFCV